MVASDPKFGPERHPAGSIIIRQGDIPEKFYLITAGRVEVARREAGGDESIINRLETGDFFGEIGLLQQSRRVATIRAITDVHLMAMDRRTFRSWLDSSLLSRDEVNAVMRHRLRTIEDLQLVDPEMAGEAADSAPATTISDGSQESQTDRPDRPDEPTTLPDPPQSRSQHFDPGQIIIRQGEPADKFFIIVHGDVAVIHQDEEGQEIEVARLSDGNYFGEVGLMEGKVRMATVQAKTAVDALVFDRTAFGNWLSEAPFVSSELKDTAQQRVADTQSQQMNDQAAE